MIRQKQEFYDDERVRMARMQPGNLDPQPPDQ